MQLRYLGSIAQTGLEIVAILIFSPDGATEVITAIDDILNPGEAVLIAACTIGLSADIHLGMSQDVGITGTTEGIIDTTITQVDKGIAADIAFVTTTIYIFVLCEVLHSALIGRGSHSTVKVHCRTVGFVENIFLTLALYIHFLTYHA